LEWEFVDDFKSYKDKWPGGEQCGVSCSNSSLSRPGGLVVLAGVLEARIFSI